MRLGNEREWGEGTCGDARSEFEERSGARSAG